MSLIEKWFKHEKRDVKRFVRKYSEFLTIPLGIVIWEVGNLYYQNRHISDIYSDGIFQKILFSIVAILFIKAFVWILIFLEDPYQKWLIDSENRNYKRLPILWQYIFAYLKYVLYFLALLTIVTRT